MTKVGIVLALALAAGLVQANEVEVVAVEIRESGKDRYRFEVTLKHEDTGWDHYADRWEVLTPDGAVLATRVLYHPHVDEQPFTRSLSDVEIPAGLTEVVVRGHDSVHEHGGTEMTVTVPRPAQ